MAAIHHRHGGFCRELKKVRKGPFIIGVAGGTASGKSSVCQKIIEAIHQDPSTKDSKIVCVSLDNMYRDLGPDESEKAAQGKFNFDHPDAFDLNLLTKIMKDVKEKKSTQVPKYDYRLNARISGEFVAIEPSDVVLVEGILAFYWPELRDNYDMKLFVDTDADTRLARRVRRDTAERGRSLDTILNQYTSTVKPAFEEFCLPSKKFADVIIPRGADNTVAIDLIVQSIKDVLAADQQLSPTKPNAHGDGPLPPAFDPLVDSSNKRCQTQKQYFYSELFYCEYLITVSL
ncbi:hypothetical protein EB796_022272 [Bugula neritina]|uniref:uridine/cytidine kinase n=1 Tax=Bugula neritina TaxID=10212 RepID=A0A7J7J032_BUGNE|nr:hypothetical protein EB796_022272 [Bugula neritina]